jgi:hypothetical protein
VLYLVLFLFVGGYFFWQCARRDDSLLTWNIFANAPCAIGGYGDLTNAFVHGSVSLLIPVDPRLPLAKNPYDPASRIPKTDALWDYSYYKGKYYLYFGPVPALLIDVPWQLVSGYVPVENVTVLILALANVALFALLVYLLVTRFFPDVPLGFEALVLILYVFASLMPFMCSRPAMYEIAIGGAVDFALLFFIAILCSLREESRRWRWLALASASAGLAAGCRPTAIFLLLPLGFLWLFQHRREPVGRIALGEFAAIALPALLSVAALFGYNDARFGDVFQFGNRYLMNYGDVYFHPNFELRNIPDAIWAYYLQPWHTTLEFPCIGIGSDLRPPDGIFIPDRSRELSSGLLPAAPIVLIGAVWWRYVARLAPDARAPLQFFGGLVSAWAILYGLLISAFFFVTLRYEIELQLPLLLLTTLTLLARRQLGPFTTWELVSFIVLFQVSCYLGFAFGLIGPNDWLHPYLHPGS